MERGAFRVQEAADYLGISRSKAYQLIASGCLPTLSLGGRATRIPVGALEEWMRRNTLEPTGEPLKSCISG